MRFTRASVALPRHTSTDHVQALLYTSILWDCGNGLVGGECIGGVHDFHSRNLVVIEGVCGGGGGGGGVGGAFVEGGVSGVDKYRRNRATGQLRLFGTLCFFFF